MAAALKPLNPLTAGSLGIKGNLGQLTCGGCNKSLCAKVKTVAANIVAGAGAQVVNENVTNCGHYFHTQCLVTWISKGKPTCPACRGDIKELHVINYIPKKKPIPQDMVGEVFHEESDCPICLETLADEKDQLFKGLYYQDFKGINFHPECYPSSRLYQMGHVIQLKESPAAANALQAAREARRRQNQPILFAFIRVIRAVRVFFTQVCATAAVLAYSQPQLLQVPYFLPVVVGSFLICFPLLLIEKCGESQFRD